MNTFTPQTNNNSKKVMPQKSSHIKTEALRGSIAEGYFEYTADGHGRVILKEQENARIYISPNSINGAMHGDLVKTWYIVKGRQRYGKVLAVLKRSHTTLVGQVETAEDGKTFIKPFNNRIKGKIQFTDIEKNTIREGEYLSARIVRYPTAADPTIVVSPSKRLGSPGEKSSELGVVIHAYNLPTEFPVTVLAETDGLTDYIPASETGKRKDLRKETIVTIDGESSKDFDDAISVKLLGNGNFLLGVHIADVSYYVKPGMAIDKEALKRGTSVYFADGTVIPMLPPRLSDNLCSLVPYRDRLAFTCEMEINRDGEIINARLFESVICSKARLTYGIVNKILIEGDGVLINKFGWLYKDLCLMGELARILRNKRHQNGFVDIDLPKSSPIFNESGKVTGIIEESRLFSHKLIEEFMLAANVAVNRFSKEKPFIYRVHPEPDKTKVAFIKDFLSSKGYLWNPNGSGITKKFSELIEQGESNGEGEMVRLLLLHEATKKAKYTSTRALHFALNFNSYTHFTSPIRRYADLLAHRLLKTYIGNRSYNLMQSEASVEMIAQQCNQTSDKADTAENEFSNWKKLEYLKGMIGGTLDGIVTRLYDKMFFVTLKRYGISAPILLSEINHDRYILNRERYSLIGQQLRKEITVGSLIKTKLEGIDWEMRRPQLTLAA